MSAATDALQFAIQLPPASLKLILDHPSQMVQFARRIDRLRLNAEQLHELRKIRPDQWLTLANGLRDKPSMRQALDRMGSNGDALDAVRAVPELELENDVKKGLEVAGIIIAAVFAIIEVIAVIIASVLGLIALIGGPVGAFLAILAAAIAIVVSALAVPIILVGCILALIAQFLPSHFQEPLGTQSFGGMGGAPFADDTSAVASIKAIVLRCGTHVDGLMVKYRTHDGAEKDTPWHGGQGGGQHTIAFEDGEYITSVNGRSGNVIDQLTFVTSRRVSGPYGGGGGGPFELKPEAGDRILGFHGRSGSLLDALGVSSALYGSGRAFGGSGGSPFLLDLSKARRITGVVVRSGSYIDALQVQYIDADGKPAVTPSVGGGGGGSRTVTFADDERITGMSTCSGTYVDRLVIMTNKNPAGYSFGGPGGGPNLVWTIDGDEVITSFWGRAGSLIDAFGITKAKVEGIAPAPAVQPVDTPPDEIGPTVASQPADSHPPAPEDLRMQCFGGPDGGMVSECPVLQWRGLTYWPYSYGDNRESMGVVAYEPDGQIHRVLEVPGARYVWKISVDRDARTVAFHGQDDSRAVISWDGLLGS